MVDRVDRNLTEYKDTELFSHPLTTADIGNLTVTKLPSSLQAIPKEDIRSSLEASTIDGIFAVIFMNCTGGALLSNFLVDLQASTIEIGMLASLPMIVNVLQPLGAYLSNRTTSRHLYGLRVYIPARLLWLLLILGIALVGIQSTYHHHLVLLTLGLVLLSSILSALGGASWMSWLATLVPARLRGRYFSIRNILCSLTSLVFLPFAGLIVSLWPGGTIKGYGMVLGIGIVAGVISLLYQCFMVDINPQVQQQAIAAQKAKNISNTSNLAELEHGYNLSNTNLPDNPLRNPNLLTFLLYFGAWTFAVNLSAPFFNVYMLENLNLDVTWVTLLNSLSAGATMLMLLVWGKVSDRIGNRPLLLLVGTIVAITPWLWLFPNPQDGFLPMFLILIGLHLLNGATWAAIDLCNMNIQMSIAPVWQHSSFFALTGAMSGITGAIGTTVGGYLAEFAHYDGIMGVFFLSGALRLLALIPLLFLKEERSQSIRKLLLPLWSSLANKLARIGDKTS